MSVKRFSVWILVLAFNCAALRAPAEGGEEPPHLALKAPERAVKGFPLVLKVTGTGRQVLPRLSVFEETAEVAVILKPEHGQGPEHRIESSRGQEIIMQTPEGHRVDAARMFRVVVAEGEERSMLLDLSSLRPEIGKGLTLADIPPGKYNMQIEYPYTGARSAPVRFELVGASDEENEFINRTLVDPETRLQRSWSAVLRQSMVIHDQGFDALSSTAKGQLRFHLLLSKALTATSASERLTEQLRAQVVPEYLQPEKRVLLLEVAIAGEPDGDTQAQIEQLVKAYPDLKWRIDKIKKSGKSFLRYAKLASGKRGENK